MSLYKFDNKDKSVGMNYNVEYKWGNEKCSTFSGILENVDNDSFWFRVDGYISKVQQDRVIWMLPVQPIKDKDVINIGDRFEGNDMNVYTVIEIVRNLGESDQVHYRLVCKQNDYVISEIALKKYFRKYIK